MSTIQDLFQQAQLAEAAYANFFDNSGNLITTNAGVSTALQNDGMSEKQAAEFVKHWRVKHDVCAMTFAEHSRSMAGEIAVAILALKEEK